MMTTVPLAHAKIMALVLIREGALFVNAPQVFKVGIGLKPFPSNLEFSCT